MKKSLIIKTIYFFCVFSIIQIILGNYNVRATDVIEENDIEKINIEDDIQINDDVEINIDIENLMVARYDAKTNEVTQVRMKDITDKVALLKATRNMPSNCTEPYIPEISKLSNEKRNRPVLYTEPDYAYHKVNDTTEYPYISTCKLDIDNGNYVGSGFMVGPNLMLTAAHNIFNPDNSVKPWYAYPAYNDGMYENYKSGWQVIHTLQIWLDGRKEYPDIMPDAYAKYDWALIELDWDMGYGVGCYGCEAYTQNNSELNGVETRLVGYPGSIDFAKYQYYIDSKIFGTQDLFFYCAHANREGMSGGPIMRKSSNYALGLIKGNKQNAIYEDIEYTYGVRISQYIIDMILSLRTD